MLIATTIEKKFGIGPGEIVELPDLFPVLIVTLEQLDTTLSASGGDESSGGFFDGLLSGDIDPEDFAVGIFGQSSGSPNPLPPEIFIRAVSSGFTTVTGFDLGVTSEILDAFAGGNLLYRLVGVVVDQNGVLLRAVSGGIIGAAPGLDGATVSIPLDPITGRVEERFPPSVQTNQPGWDGAAVSIREFESDTPIAYAFDPLPNVPYFTGLTEEDSGFFLRPSDYFAAFEVFGLQAKIWYDNKVVFGPFTWSLFDRFRIVHANGTTQFFVNAELKWSS